MRSTSCTSFTTALRWARSVLLPSMAAEMAVCGNFRVVISTMDMGGLRNVAIAGELRDDVVEEGQQGWGQHVGKSVLMFALMAFLVFRPLVNSMASLARRSCTGHAAYRRCRYGNWKVL
ncbi:MAG: hypothetical protein R2818_08180 [Flavobacteriales bacterium]